MKVYDATEPYGKAARTMETFEGRLLEANHKAGHSAGRRANGLPAYDPRL
jgi:hypothetical protein